MNSNTKRQQRPRRRLDIEVKPKKSEEGMNEPTNQRTNDNTINVCRATGL